MFMLPMKVEKDGEVILISNRAELQRFVEFANLLLELTRTIEEKPLAPSLVGSKADVVLVQTEKPKRTEASNEPENSKPLSLQRAERIYEIGRTLGPFVARDIGKIVASEPLFRVPGGDPKHIIRGAMREHPHLFKKFTDGSGKTVTNDFPLEPQEAETSQSLLFQEEMASDNNVQEDISL